MRKSKTVRKQEAAERNKSRQALTPQQQLAALDDRLGVGVGATKERARLEGLQ